MSYNHAKVNPFYIQDDEEHWDDDGEEDSWGEDYDDEQVMLIGANGGVKNRKYNDSTAVSRVPDRTSGQPNFGRSYHDGQYEVHDRDRIHRPQLWKYGIILTVLVIAATFGSIFSSEEGSTDGNSFSKASLFKDGPTDDYRIVVLGERHSGTAWMRDRLRECFPRADISSDLQRMGYFFQDDEETARLKEETPENLRLHQKEKNSPNTIVVHVTLNVYDWLEQMRLSPEYAPNHVGEHHELGHVIPLGWKEFLSKPWTMERPSTDLPLANETGAVCQMGFHYNEVVSCTGPTGGIGDPLYELDDDGHPFESIMNLRSAKLQNHYNVLESWPSVTKMIHMPYETIAKDFKTKLLQEILDFTAGNDHNGDSLPCSGNVLPPSLDSSNGMTLEFVDYVTNNADWDTETVVASYVPWTESEIVARGIGPAASTSAQAAPTDPPVSPTDAPVATPTDPPVSPTDAPVAAPTDAPISSTDAPVPAPTDAPVVALTDAPVPAPTDAPISPTDAPVAAPTDAPISPTDAPAVAPTDAPVNPTDAPVAAPTDAPVSPTE